MSSDTRITPADSRSVGERSQVLAAALSSYARALTFENRSRRNLYRLAGLAPRLRDRILSKLLMLAFVFCFALPFTGLVAYYTLLVTPQFSSEVRFVVRSASPILSRDRYSGDGVEPKAKIVQDTAVLLNFLESSAMVEELEKKIDFARYFGSDDIDFLSRLPSDASQEETLDYWKSKHSSWVNPKSGIVELEARAFSARQAFDLMQVVLELTEDRVNQLNSGMWDSLHVSAENDLRSASKQLEDWREEYRKFQNETGVYDVSLNAESLFEVQTSIETDLARLKTQRTALRQTVNSGSPRLVELDRAIAARELQVKTLASRVAGETPDGEGNLARHSKRFEELKLNLEMSEQRLTSAIEELEKVKLVSSLQLVYLDTFTEPTLPEDSNYPNVPLKILLGLLACLVVWGVVAGAIIMLRNRLD